MKRIIAFIFLTLAGFSAFAAVTEVTARIANGMPNLALAPFGSIVNIDTGEVIYVRGVISVLAPNQLREDCVYKFHYVLDETVRYKAVRLVPPTELISCGLQLPKDR